MHSPLPNCQPGVLGDGSGRVPRREPTIYPRECPGMKRPPWVLLRALACSRSWHSPPPLYRTVRFLVERAVGPHPWGKPVVLVDECVERGSRAVTSREAPGVENRHSRPLALLGNLPATGVMIRLALRPAVWS